MNETWIGKEKAKQKGGSHVMKNVSRNQHAYLEKKRRGSMYIYSGTWYWIVIHKMKMDKVGGGGCIILIVCIFLWLSITITITITAAAATSGDNNEGKQKQKQKEKQASFWEWKRLESAYSVYSMLCSASSWQWQIFKELLKQAYSRLFPPPNLE